MSAAKPSLDHGGSVPVAAEPAPEGLDREWARRDAEIARMSDAEFAAMIKAEFATERKQALEKMHKDALKDEAREINRLVLDTEAREVERLILDDNDKRLSRGDCDKANHGRQPPVPGPAPCPISCAASRARCMRPARAACPCDAPPASNAVAGFPTEPARPVLVHTCACGLARSRRPSFAGGNRALDGRPQRARLPPRLAGRRLAGPRGAETCEAVRQAAGQREPHQIGRTVRTIVAYGKADRKICPRVIIIDYATLATVFAL